MEANKNTLQNALHKLSSHEPDEQVWRGIEQGLNEQPLQKALKNLPDYFPGDAIWEKIENQASTQRSSGRSWWYAAAAILLMGALGLWFTQEGPAGSVSYTEEKVDVRLLANEAQSIDYQYQKLKAYCEAETMICSNGDFKRLRQEYEILDTAATRLQQAMGSYNTEPELMRQFTLLEQEKAEVLNEMAKMI